MRTKIPNNTGGSPNLGASPCSVIYNDKMYVYGGSDGGQQLWELDLNSYYLMILK